MAKYAIIEADGRQYIVAEGDVLRCDEVDAAIDSTITFERVVLVNDAGRLEVGAPLVAGATVTATVLRQIREKKILVFKYKPKKRVRKLFGHRQNRAEVRIDQILVPAAA